VFRLIYCYVESHYAECRYAECRYAEFRYAEFRYTECHYAECRGSLYIGLRIPTQVIMPEAQITTKKVLREMTQRSFII
jgi:hypothetical protein